MTFVYGFLGGVVGSAATMGGLGLVLRRALVRSPLAGMVKR